MIFTGSYENNPKGKNLVAISGDRGRKANYEGMFYSRLAPKKFFYNIWFNNKGKISEYENNKYYIIHYYNEVLKNLDSVTEHLTLINKVMLCYEEPHVFCHRHIVAAWFELTLNVKVYEIKQKKQ